MSLGNPAITNHMEKNVKLIRSNYKSVTNIKYEFCFQTFREQTLDIMKKTLTVLQIFAISQFGCGGRDFQKNVLKRTTKGNHWGLV